MTDNHTEAFNLVYKAYLLVRDEIDHDIRDDFNKLMYDIINIQEDR